MDKLNLSQLGEKLMTSGAQMGRIMSVKMKEVKEMLQAPTPESKMVEDATSETLSDPNWGTNLRICAMINSDQLNGSEVVRAIKRRLSHKNPLVHSLTLDLLEASAMNCDKVFSEIASEKLLDEMISKLLDNPHADPNVRRRAFHLIRAWGLSQDLAYLPVFRQTYMSLQERAESVDVGGGSSPGVPHNLGSYLQQQGLDPPSSYPVPEAGLVSMDDLAFSSGLQHMSAEEKKELLVVARNSLELLSSIINSEAEPKTLKEDLTLSLLDKCKHSLSIMKEIAESTTDDEETLFEALYLNDELQQIVSKYEELEAAQRPVAQETPNADTAKHDAEAVQNPIELPKRFEEDESKEFEAAQELERKLPKKSNGVEANAANGDGHHVETTILDEADEKGNAESSLKSNRE
ncbi:TOM1-like protein 2 [Arachis stenosperma]|uniref:TOM1-like protein 2 n=1 Tax=Arachis stenosperma TaxID=217475 RepID=UPI0025ACD80A|nr:TOM1-like protein 2 [Arachis stenosperma]